MSVTTRTNLATRPLGDSVTNWAAIAGTGGTAALTNQTTAGYSGNNFNRVTWSVANTALGGGGSYTEPSGLSASTAYAVTLYVKSSKAQRMFLRADFRNSSNTIVNTVNGSSILLSAGVWTALQVTGTSGAAVTNIVLSALVDASTGSLWANGDTLDMDAPLIEAGSTFGTYFDGSFVSAASIVYAWTAGVGTSTSTAATYVPTISVVTKTTFDPCPRAEITIADLAPGNSTINAWRTADQLRRPVRGARGRAVNGSDFFVDYEPPFGRTIAYDLEILSGISAQAVVTTASVTCTPATGCIQDVLVPGSAIPLFADYGTSGEPTLEPEAVKNLEYAADMSVMAIIGSPDPVAIMGQRMNASNVDFSAMTNAAQQSTSLRNLLKETAMVLVRPLPNWAGALPGLCYFASPKPIEQPVNEAWGGQFIKFKLVGDLVAAPTATVLVPIWTYGTVEALWTTYQQQLTTFAGKTYLDALKSPPG